MTREELRLWVCLRHDFPWKFRRQEPIGPYICDFVCYPKRLVIEVDGIQHADNPKDTARDAYLSGQGFRIVRVWNGDVMARLDDVLDVIAGAIAEQPDLHRSRVSRDADSLL
jgi:very-short-patch-repair endonuclease